MLSILFFQKILVLKDKHGDISSTELNVHVGLSWNYFNTTAVMCKHFESILLHLYGELLSSDILQYVHMLFSHSLWQLNTLLIVVVKSIIH